MLAACRLRLWRFTGSALNKYENSPFKNAITFSQSIDNCREKKVNFKNRKCLSFLCPGKLTVNPRVNIYLVVQGRVLYYEKMLLK